MGSRRRGKRLLIVIVENGIALHPADGCGEGAQPGKPEFSFEVRAFPSQRKWPRGPVLLERDMHLPSALLKLHLLLTVTSSPQGHPAHCPGSACLPSPRGSSSGPLQPGPHGSPRLSSPGSASEALSSPQLCPGLSATPFTANTAPRVTPHFTSPSVTSQSRHPSPHACT